MKTLRIPPHLFAVLMLGLVSQVSQVLLLREFLMIFHGNELSIGIILAAWLFWVGIGSKAGFWITKSKKNLINTLVYTAIGVTLFLPLSIIIIRNLRGFIEILPGAYLSITDIFIATFSMIAPVTILLGIQFVLLANIWRLSDKASDTSGAGKTYLTEAAGNMAGGILFTLVIVHYLNVFQAAALVSLMMVISCFFLLYRARIKEAGRTALSWSLVVFITLVIVASPTLESLDQWAYRLKWGHFIPQHELITVEHSKHGAIAIVKYEEQYSFYQSGHLLFSTYGPEALSPGLEELEAITYANFALVQHRAPEQILLIGGGLGGMLAEITKHPVKRIDYVELDEKLVALAKEYMPILSREAFEDPRVNIIHGDGRMFTKTTGATYDLIIVDIPDPATAVLNRYYTKEFFQEIKDTLNPGGVLTLKLKATSDSRGTAIANRNSTVYHTLRSIYPSVVVAADRDIFFFASDNHGQITTEPDVLEARYTDRELKDSDFSPWHYYQLLDKDQLQRLKWILNNHGRSPDAHIAGPLPLPLAPGSIEEQSAEEQMLPPVEERYFINSDLKPIAYYYTIMFWTELTRNGHTDLLKQLLLIKPYWPGLLFLLLLLPAIYYRLSKTVKTGKPFTAVNYALSLAILTTGFSTMVLQVTILFIFQSTYGFVYELIGLIIALFMGGLAVGTYLANRFIKDKSKLQYLMAVQGTIAFYALFMSIVIPVSSNLIDPVTIFIITSLITFFAGLVNGIDFPLASSCLMAININADKSGSKVYSIELFGASLGAIITSVFVAPVLGLQFSCLLAALANGTAFVVILLSGGDYNCLAGKTNRGG